MYIAVHTSGKGNRFMLEQINAAEQINNLITKNSSTILSKVTAFLTDEAKKVAVDLETPFSKYLLAAYEKYSKIKTLLYKNEPRYLYDFYVCCNISHNHDSFDSSIAYDQLCGSHFNIIVGSGGTGKSMFMRHMFLDSIFRSEKIPLFFELRAYTGGDLFDHLYNVY